MNHNFAFRQRPRHRVPAMPIRVSLIVRWCAAATLALVPVIAGCGDVLSPAARNTIGGGGFVPVTPGPIAPFVFVRGVNQTNEVVEFIITVEHERLVRDENGNFTTDENGNFLTQPERETKRITTFPGGLSGDVGVLFDCSLEPVTLVGLGENLLPTDAGIFVGGSGPAGVGGFGVSPEGLNPLTLADGNFACGDTIIFTAFISVGTPGGVELRSDELISAEQPGVFSGPSTFANYADFLESQVREEE